MKKSVLAAFLVSAAAVVAVPVFADQHGKGPGHGPRGERGAPPSFESLDTNGDGVLTLEEIQAPRVERFNEMDADGDGFVTAEEIMAHMAAQMIARQDENGDGKLSIDEMRGPDFSRMFRFMDENGDGQITQEEWDAGMEAGRHFRGGHGRGPGRN